MAYIVKSAVRESIKGMRAGGDFFKELDAMVARKVKKASELAKGNGRKTLRAIDI